MSRGGGVVNGRDVEYKHSRAPCQICGYAPSKDADAPDLCRLFRVDAFRFVACGTCVYIIYAMTRQGIEGTPFAETMRAFGSLTDLPLTGDA